MISTSKSQTTHIDPITCLYGSMLMFVCTMMPLNRCCGSRESPSRSNGLPFLKTYLLCCHAALSDAKINYQLSIANARFNTIRETLWVPAFARRAMCYLSWKQSSPPFPSLLSISTMLLSPATKLSQHTSTTRPALLPCAVQDTPGPAYIIQ